MSGLSWDRFFWIVLLLLPWDQYEDMVSLDASVQHGLGTPDFLLSERERVSLGLMLVVEISHLTATTVPEECLTDVALTFKIW